MENKKPRVISINSPSGGGKTTITRALADKMPNSTALYFDDRDYDSESGITDICRWVDEGADVNKFDLRLLASDIECCIGKEYNYIFLDYPFGYRHKQIAKYLDLSIFIDTPLDIAFARRLLRDYADKTTTEILKDADFYLRKGRSAYLHGDRVARADADSIIDGSLSVNEIVSKISSEIISI